MQDSGNDIDSYSVSVKFYEGAKTNSGKGSDKFFRERRDFIEYIRWSLAKYLCNPIFELKEIISRPHPPIVVTS